MTFPDTHHSAILGLRDEDATVRRGSYEAVIAAYWKPAYKYVRLRWREPEDSAQDLTQDFFARAIEKDTLASYDPLRATFRGYLKRCLDSTVLNARKYTTRQKRSGGASALPLDFESAEGELRRYEPASHDDLDGIFHREWVRSLFALALEDLRKSNRQPHLSIFELYDLSDAPDRPTYEELGRRFQLPATTITNYLSAIRRDLRRAVLARLRELTATDREFRSEARAVLGIEAE